jgi:hypothetical protein
MFEGATTTSTTFQTNYHFFRYYLRRFATPCSSRDSRCNPFDQRVSGFSASAVKRLLIRRLQVRFLPGVLGA